MSSCSVALCVCNGARFLEEQLSSLNAQTSLPGELVICDDASDDESVRILEKFAEAALFDTRLTANATRLGVRQNFEQAIGQCSKEFVALCDQDDVWLPQKLSTLVSLLAKDPGTSAVFSDAMIVSADLSPLGYTMWQQIGFSSERRRLLAEDRPWEVLVKDPVVTGATLVFRRRLLEFILPIPEGWMHDAWIAQIAASQGRLVAVDEPLVLYRQHEGNVIGGKRVSIADQIRRAQALGRTGLIERELTRHRALRDRLVTFSSTARRDEMLSAVHAKLDHLARRRDVPNNRVLRGKTVLREWLNGNYGRFAKDWRNIAADLFMP